MIFLPTFCASPWKYTCCAWGVYWCKATKKELCVGAVAAPVWDAVIFLSVVEKIATAFYLFWFLVFFPLSTPIWSNSKLKENKCLNSSAKPAGVMQVVCHCWFASWGFDFSKQFFFRKSQTSHFHRTRRYWRLQRLACTAVAFVVLRNILVSGDQAQVCCLLPEVLSCAATQKGTRYWLERVKSLQATFFSYSDGAHLQLTVWRQISKFTRCSS